MLSVVKKYLLAATLLVPITAFTAQQAPQNHNILAEMQKYLGHDIPGVVMGYAWDDKALEQINEQIGSHYVLSPTGELRWKNKFTQWTTLSGDKLNQAIPFLWNPDGNRIAAASHDRTIWIWNSASGACERILRGHTHVVYLISWNHDGSRIASASVDEIRVWNSTTGVCEQILSGGASPANSISWSPDGSHIASAHHNNTIRIWNSSSGACEQVWRPSAHFVISVAWSPDGSHILATYTDKMQILNSSTGDCEHSLVHSEFQIKSASWSPNGNRIVSVSDDRTLKIWDSITGTCEQILSGHTAYVSRTSWSPDGSRIASVSDDKTIRIWNSSTGVCEQVLRGHAGQVTSASWNHDGGRILTTSFDGKVRIWNSITGICEQVLINHINYVWAACWNHDGSRIAIKCYGKTIQIWQTRGLIGKLNDTQMASLYQAAQRNQAKTEINNILACLSQAHLNPHKLPSVNKQIGPQYMLSSTGELLGATQWQEQGIQHSVCSAFWNPRGDQLITVSPRGIVRTIDEETGICTEKLLSGITGSVLSASLSQDGKDLATTSWNNKVYILNNKTGVCTAVLNRHTGILERHNNVINSVSWSPNGELITTSFDKTVYVGYPEGMCIGLSGHTDAVLSAASKGNRLATTSRDKTARIWVGELPLSKHILRGHEGAVNSVSWSPDGNHLVTGSCDNTARIWNSTTGICTIVLSGHTASVNTVAWSPDGNHIATASDDKTIRIWNSETGACEQVLKGHADAVRTVSWHPDCSRIVSTSYDGTARVWQRKSLMHLNNKQTSKLYRAEQHNGAKSALNAILTQRMWANIFESHAIRHESTRRAPQNKLGEFLACTTAKAIMKNKNAVRGNHGPYFAQATKGGSSSALSTDVHPAVPIILRLKKALRESDTSATLSSEERAILNSCRLSDTSGNMYLDPEIHQLIAQVDARNA